jgi:hypothetical protein
MAALCLALIAAIASTASASRLARTARSCSPPTGPGDNLVHSARVRIRNYDCRSARHLMIHCDRFSYRHHGYCRFQGLRWYCSSRVLQGSSSSERCSAARGRLVSWIWLD